MTPTCLEFAGTCLSGINLEGMSVLEVGARDVNGSTRPLVARRCAEYIGVDIEPGQGVDRICDVKDLATVFRADRFDLVVCTEVVEHVAGWRGAVANLKAVLKPGGYLLLTTRSRGFGYHGYPYDFWRYGRDDMKCIFSDFEMQSLEEDPELPGIFVFARKPLAGWKESDLGTVNLYSVLHHRRIGDMPVHWDRTLSFRIKTWAMHNKALLKKLVPHGLRERIYNRVFR